MSKTRIPIKYKPREPRPTDRDKGGHRNLVQDALEEMEEVNEDGIDPDRPLVSR